eukprot:11849105-Alexandrium_andersonii.AAC.1
MAGERAGPLMRTLSGRTAPSRATRAVEPAARSIDAQRLRLLCGRLALSGHTWPGPKNPVREVAERAVWPVGRAGTATSRAGFSGPGQF